MMSLRWAQGMAPALLAWCAGVALQLQQSQLWSAPVYGAMGVLALAGLGWPAWRRMGAFIGVCLACALLSFACTGWHALWKLPAMPPELEGQDLELVGVVQAMPHQQDMGWRFRFRVEAAWRLGGLAGAGGRTAPGASARANLSGLVWARRRHRQWLEPVVPARAGASR